MEEYEKVVDSLIGIEFHTKNPAKLDLDLKNCIILLAKLSILEPLKIELRPLPPHLKYMFLGDTETFPIIFASYLSSY